MPKPHEHKLDIVCLQCVINLRQDYEKLLTYIKKIKTVYDDETIGMAEILNLLFAYASGAEDLLKEIGEV